MLDADATYSPEDIPRFIDGLVGMKLYGESAPWKMRVVL